MNMKDLGQILVSLIFICKHQFDVFVTPEFGNICEQIWFQFVTIIASWLGMAMLTREMLIFTNISANIANMHQWASENIGAWPFLITMISHIENLLHSSRKSYICSKIITYKHRIYACEYIETSFQLSSTYHECLKGVTGPSPVELVLLQSPPCRFIFFCQ